MVTEGRCNIKLRKDGKEADRGVSQRPYKKLVEVLSLSIWNL